MPDSNISPPEPVDPFGQSKESGPLADNGPQDEALNTDVDESQAVGKATSAILSTSRPTNTFHRFSDLPPEIRSKIWAMAWPTRSILPYSSKPAPQTHCRGRRPCQLCKAFSWSPPVRAPTVMQACHEARLETQKISKPLSTWMLEIDLPEFLNPSMSRAQEREFRDNMAYREEMIPLVTHYNADADMIVLWGQSIFYFSQFPGPPNHNDVFQVALDPEIPVMLDGHMFDPWDTPVEAYGQLSSGLQALYHRYLKTRKHIHIAVGGIMTFALTEIGWQKAIREGLFSGQDEETRLIPVHDVALITKYQNLRYYCFQHTKRSERMNLDRSNLMFNGKPNVWHNYRLGSGRDAAGYSRWISSRLTASRENVPDAQLFMLQMADFLMWDLGLGQGKGEEIMDLDGHLKKNHPIVEGHGLKLPDFTAVVVFQAFKSPEGDCSTLFDRLPHMRPKFPEEDSSHWRLSLRRRVNGLLGRWGRSL